MPAEYTRLTLDAAAATAELEIAIVRRYAELGLIAAPAGYGAPELAELRRVRRLMHELELDHPAIEIVLRMRRQLLALQAEIRRLEAELRSAAPMPAVGDMVDAEWEDLI
jgi:hypothetical protein